MDFIWVALGGALGAVCRYAFGLAIMSRVGSDFPWHTLLINVSGSLAIGILMVLFAERAIPDPMWRLLTVVGFLGGYTTFSSFSLDAFALLESGQWPAAAWYVLGSNGLSLLATWGGILAARALSR